MTEPARRMPLTVVALGGNALSPPRPNTTYEEERRNTAVAAQELAELASTGARLLIVHGNGPQVGRLLSTDAEDSEANLDIHVAQTQGELGYLLSKELDARLDEGATVCLLTRATVNAGDPALGDPSKPIGPVLTVRPSGAAIRTAVGAGWRRVVASPRPESIVEEEAIRLLLERFHVVAGGGGGVAVAADGEVSPVAAVVDKDWVASLLAIHFNAEQLVFVTDVPSACKDVAHPEATAIRSMTAREARGLLTEGVFARGSMAPKIESAAEFVEATLRDAVIAQLGSVQAALRGEVGTQVIAGG